MNPTDFRDELERAVAGSRIDFHVGTLPGDRLDPTPRGRAVAIKVLYARRLLEIGAAVVTRRRHGAGFKYIATLNRRLSPSDRVAVFAASILSPEPERRR
jgi:hypothetical protein